MLKYLAISPPTSFEETSRTEGGTTAQKLSPLTSLVHVTPPPILYHYLDLLVHLQRQFLSKYNDHQLPVVQYYKEILYPPSVMTNVKQMNKMIVILKFLYKLCALLECLHGDIPLKYL